MARKEEELTGAIIDAIIAVHRALGPGFSSAVYRNAVMVDLKRSDYAVEEDRDLIILYENEEVGTVRLDLIVEGRVIVRTITVDELTKAHHAEVRSCLHAAGLEVGLLVNFAGDRADFRRIE
jgi:GxxExxY protein